MLQPPIGLRAERNVRSIVRFDEMDYICDIVVDIHDTLECPYCNPYTAIPPRNY